MKNLFRFIIAAAAGILAAACAKEYTQDAASSEGLIPITFNAVADEIDARTQLGEGGMIKFSVGEEVSVFYKKNDGTVVKSGQNAVCTAFDATTGIATFSGLVAEDADLTKEIIAVAGDDNTGGKGCVANDKDPQTGDPTSIFDYTFRQNSCMRTTISNEQTAAKGQYAPLSFSSFGIAPVPAEGEVRTVHFQTVPGLVSYELENTSGKNIKAVYIYAAEADDTFFKNDPELINRYSGMTVRYFYYIGQEGYPVQDRFHGLPSSYVKMTGFAAAGDDGGRYYGAVRPDLYRGVKVAFLNADDRILVANGNFPNGMLVKRNTATALPKFTITGAAPWEEAALGIDKTEADITPEGGRIAFKVTGNCPWKATLKKDGKTLSEHLFPQDGIGASDVVLKVDACDAAESHSYVVTIESDGLASKKSVTLTVTQKAAKPAIINFGTDVMNEWIKFNDGNTHRIGDAEIKVTVKESGAGPADLGRYGETTAAEDILGGGQIPAGAKYFQGCYSFTIHELRPGRYKLSFNSYIKSASNTTAGASLTMPKVTVNGTQVSYTNYYYNTAEGYKNIGSNNKSNVNLYNISAYVVNIDLTEEIDNKIQITNGISSNYLKLYCSDNCPIRWERIGDLPTE